MPLLRHVTADSTESEQTFTANDGTVFYGDDARDVGGAYWDEQERKRREAFRRLSPAARRSYMTYLRTGTPPPALPCGVTVRCGRAPRIASNTRTRGSRRTTSSRGSPGSDDPGGEGEPARGRHLDFDLIGGPR